MNECMNELNFIILAATTVMRKKRNRNIYARRLS